MRTAHKHTQSLTTHFSFLFLDQLAAKATSTNKNDEALSELQTRMHDLAVAGQAAVR